MPQKEKASWETFYHLSTRESTDPVNGELILTQNDIRLTTNDSTTTIQFSEIIDITIGTPPKMFHRDFNETINIKFNASTNQTEVCIIESQPEYESVFSYGVFKKILSDTEVLFQFGAEKGGRTVDSTVKRAKLTLSKQGLQFTTPEGVQQIELGSIIKLKTGTRKIRNDRRQVLTLKHTHEKTVYTTHIAIGADDLMRLFRRFIKTTYGELLEEAKSLDLDESITQLVVGLYTTGSPSQTANVVCNGNDDEFKILYQQALSHGLVTAPNKSSTPSLTQKGKLIANKNLETINQ